MFSCQTAITFWTSQARLERSPLINAGWSVRVLTIQFSVGQNAAGRTIGVLNYGGPLGLPLPTGAGYGLSVSAYNTNTVTTSGRGCGCR
jgi:hypothetical protein